MLRSRDTSPEAHAAQLAAYRRMTGSRRIELALEISEGVRATSRAGIKARHPEYTDEEAEDALRRLVLGDDLFRAAWPARRLLAP